MTTGEATLRGGDVPSLDDFGMSLGLAVGCETCGGLFGHSVGIAGESDSTSCGRELKG